MFLFLSISQFLQSENTFNTKASNKGLGKNTPHDNIILLLNDFGRVKEYKPARSLLNQLDCVAVCYKITPCHRLADTTDIPSDTQFLLKINQWPDRLRCKITKWSNDQKIKEHFKRTGRDSHQQQDQSDDKSTKHCKWIKK